jgi:hypothetical protein
MQPHRGGLILALGILGFILCQLLGPVAWILGIIATVLIFVMILVFVGLFVLGAGAAAIESSSY